MDKSENFENSLPGGYVLVKHVDAKTDKKQTYIYTFLSLVPILVIVPLLCVIANYCSGYNVLKRLREDNAAVVMLIACLVLVVYTVLHELTHGITYKIFTGGKLTFGMTLFVAFCGVPDLYVRKKASIASLVMPFTVFSIVFIALTAGLWFVSPIYGIAAGFVFAVHAGGCVGDLHWTIMYFTKFRRCDTLMRDTGPEQWLYIPEEQAREYNIPIMGDNAARPEPAEKTSAEDVPVEPAAPAEKTSADTEA